MISEEEKEEEDEEEEEVGSIIRDLWRRKLLTMHDGAGLSHPSQSALS